MKNHNLPAHTTPFVGRRHEIAETIDLLNNADCRLLTLVGAGGIGKTRLAIEVGSRKIHDFSDGVFFVSLASLPSADNISSTIASSLSLQLREGTTVQKQLLDYLSGCHLLLIMDNFEHLLDGVHLVAEILRNAPQVKILVTSREALNLQGEWLRKIRGLDIPDTDEVESIEAYSALQLFMECVRRVQGNFDEQACAIRVCRLVEGMPLAIELAAAWLKTMPCSKVIDEIQKNVDFLATNMRDIAERHRSIRAVFEHSWSLLDVDEQAIFRKLAVFRGGFEQDAAEQIADASLYTLTGLVEKSLLRMTTSGRYETHQLLHQYIEEKLGEIPEAQEHVRNLHCEYYAELLHKYESDVQGARRQQVLRMIESEINNVRAAWNHAVIKEKIPEIHKSIISFNEFYFSHTWYQEAENAFSDAIAMLEMSEASGERGLCLGLVLAYLGTINQTQGKHKLGKERALESVAILRRCGETRDLAIALFYQGLIAYWQSDFRNAQAILEESIILATKFGDHWTQLFASDTMGLIVRVLGNPVEAEQFHQASLEIARRLQASRLIADVGHHLGSIALDTGAYEKAREYYQESLSINTRIGRSWMIAHHLELLGQISHAMGQFEQARKYYMQSMEMAQEIGIPRRMAFVLIGLGNLALAQGELDRAQECYEKSLAISNEFGQLWQKARALKGLGQIAYQRERYTQSRQYHEESLALLREMELQLEMAGSMRELGLIATAIGNNKAAKQYFYEALRIGQLSKNLPLILSTFVAAAELLLTEGQYLFPAKLLTISLHHHASHADTRQHCTQLLGRLQPELQSEVYARVQYDALVDMLDDIVLELLDTLDRNNPEKNNHLSCETITARELDVLRLLANRRTNREIADELVISIGTVKTHIHNVCSKLGVSGRRNAVAQAQKLHIL